MKTVIFNQILGTIMLFLLLLVIIFAAIMTKEIVWIIASIILGLLVLLFTLNAIKVIKKEKGVKIKNDINYNIFIGLIIICTMFGISLFLFIKNISFRINGVETTAIVYDINRNINYKTDYDEDGNSYRKKEEKCDVFIKYKAENEEYDKKLDVNSCNYSIGDEIKIYYDKDNPENFVSNSITILIFATLFTGLVLLIFIIQWIKSYSKKGHVKKARKK